MRFEGVATEIKDSCFSILQQKTIVLDGSIVYQRQIKYLIWTLIESLFSENNLLQRGKVEGYFCFLRDTNNFLSNVINTKKNQLMLDDLVY